MLTTKPVTKQLPQLSAIGQLLRTQFPAAEQMPLSLLLWKAKKPYVDFLAFYEGDSLVGFAYLVTKGDLTFVLYIAVDPAIQSRGYGSRVLGHIRRLYPSGRIVLNIEAPDAQAPNNAQRVKRRQFYLKNGYSPSGITLEDTKMRYEILVNGGGCTIEECQALYRRYAGALLYLFIKPRQRYTIGLLSEE